MKAIRTRCSSLAASKAACLPHRQATSSALYQSIGIGQVAKPSLAACCCCCCCCRAQAQKTHATVAPASVTRQGLSSTTCCKQKPFVVPVRSLKRGTLPCDRVFLDSVFTVHCSIRGCYIFTLHLHPPHHQHLHHTRALANKKTPGRPAAAGAGAGAAAFADDGMILIQDLAQYLHVPRTVAAPPSAKEAHPTCICPIHVSTRTLHLKFQRHFLNDFQLNHPNPTSSPPPHPS